jgi:hypothetical protein
MIARERKPVFSSTAEAIAQAVVPSADRHDGMRSLRLAVFLAAFALVGVSFTAAAAQARVAGTSDTTSTGERTGQRHGHPRGTSGAVHGGAASPGGPAAPPLSVAGSAAVVVLDQGDEAHAAG